MLSKRENSGLRYRSHNMQKRYMQALDLSPGFVTAMIVFHACKGVRKYRKTPQEPKIRHQIINSSRL
jgi:hypothetical protein